ncbi:MAG: hypothetical protein V1838_01805 [Patescibacteria group bacterium]
MSERGEPTEQPAFEKAESAKDLRESFNYFLQNEGIDPKEFAEEVFRESNYGITHMGISNAIEAGMRKVTDMTNEFGDTTRLRLLVGDLLGKHRQEYLDSLNEGKREAA